MIGILPDFRNLFPKKPTDVEFNLPTPALSLSSSNSFLVSPLPKFNFNFTDLSAAALNSYPDEYFTRPESRALELTTPERDLLGRLVYAEARGESLEGKAAVANSILNRWLSVKEGLSPETFNARGRELADIIYAENQYQPVREGKLNLPLNPAARESVDTAIDIALNPEQFRQKLAQVGKTPSEINRIMAATGFRTHYVFNDSSQNVNTAKLGGHLFNTAGNREMRSLVFERAGKKDSISTSPIGTWLSNGAFTDWDCSQINLFGCFLKNQENPRSKKHFF